MEFNRTIKGTRFLSSVRGLSDDVCRQILRHIDRLRAPRPAEIHVLACSSERVLWSTPAPPFWSQETILQEPKK